MPLQSTSGGAVLTATSWQVQNMTAEAAAHGGIQGTDLDRILPMGGAPPLAFVIGGWIATALSKNFPPVIEPTVRAILGSMFGWLKSKLDQFTAVDGSATIEVDHHIKKPPPPRPAVPGCAVTGGAIPAGTYSGSIRATVISTLHILVAGQTIQNAGGGNLPLAGSVTITSDGRRATGKLVLSGTGTAQAGQQGGLVVHETDNGSLTAAISGPATAPTIEGTLSGSWASFDAPVLNGSGSSSVPIHVGLHVTTSNCSSVTGDIVALFRQITLPVSHYLTVGGSGMWTATRR